MFYYGLAAIFFMWVLTMTLVVLLSVLDGGFGIPVKGIPRVLTIGMAVVIALIATFYIWQT